MKHIMKLNEKPFNNIKNGSRRIDLIRIETNSAWVYYIGDDSKLISNKVGKWMCFFKNNREFVEKICKEAIEKDIVYESKHSNAEEGVSCFYLNKYDVENHKKVIQYFIANGLIPKTKNGRFYNISFKSDVQTNAGQYGEDFLAEIKLDKFINLDTGEWK